ncbi:MAG: CoA transferase [Dehalococcoidia bacterium]|nr:CoA transferase [Dehalococcoidia bacterium]
MEQKQALKGVKVANFAWVGVGPLHVRYLALHGATVVRVESHARPDTLRLMMPYRGGPGINNSPWFAEINPNAYGISINMGKPSGLEIAWRLIEWADIMIESFIPGTMKKWSLDYENVRKKKPDIIYVSTCQMGQTGPYAKFAGFGYQAGGISGFTYISGMPDTTPGPTQIAYTDVIAPRFGAAALLAALDYRRRTGKGQYLEQGQFETSCHFLAPHIMDYLISKRVLERNGNRNPSAAPHGVYPCRGSDRWCALAVFNDEEWRSLACVMGRSELADAPSFATVLARKKNEDELDALIAGWTLDRTAEQLEAMLQAAGIASAVVADTEDLVSDPQLRSQGYFKKLKHSVVGEHLYRTMGFTMSRTPPELERPGPALGEHNEYVFKELLHMTDDEIADALAEGGVTTEADLPQISASL